MIRERIRKGNRAYYANRPPVVAYEAETWMLARKEQETQRQFERKIVRSVYSPVREDDE